MNPPPFLELGKEYNLLSKEREYRLSRLIMETTGFRRKDAMSELVYSNVKLVSKILQKYCHIGLDNDDLFSEGLLGLCIAAEKFDYRKGNRFSTFAYYWIRHKMHRYMEQNISIIKIPVHIQETLKVYNATYEKLLELYNREPLLSEISSFCNLSESKLLKALKFGRLHISSLCGSNDNKEIEYRSDNMLDMLRDVEFNVVLESLIGDLTEGEKLVLFDILDNSTDNMEHFTVEEYNELKESIKEKLIEFLWSDK